MDLTSLYYFSELAKDLHMTRTANRLYISQQTLSNHIQRLEEHFGTKLLYRKPTLSLTFAGEHVLAFSQRVTADHTNLQDILADVKAEERGVISFGASSMRMNTCLPYILSEFSSRYPRVELRLTDALSTQLEDMVLEGKLDFAMILPDEPNVSLIDRHLLNDQVYLCVPDPLLKEYFGDRAEEIKTQNPDVLRQVEELFAWQSVEVEFVSHVELKAKTKSCKAVIRTGEITPYANIILQSGCIFA